MFKHSVADHQQLSHTRCQSHHLGFAFVSQPLIMRFDQRVLLYPTHRWKVEGFAQSAVAALVQSGDFSHTATCEDAKTRLWKAASEPRLPLRHRVLDVTAWTSFEVL